MRQIAVLLFTAAAVAMTSAQSPKQIVNVGSTLGLPFSGAVKAGGLVYVSGTIALDASGTTTGDIKAQTARTLDQIAATLKAAGSHGTIGPNLDERRPSMDKVVERVTEGKGVMPSFRGQLTQAQIQSVAEFVSSATRGSED